MEIGFHAGSCWEDNTIWFRSEASDEIQTAPKQ